MRIFYFLMCCGLLCAAMGVKAATVSINLETVSGNGDGYTLSGGLLTITDPSNEYEISGMTSSIRVFVTTGATPVNITLIGAGISSSSNSAFAINTGVTVNLTLDGDNALKSGPTYAGLEVPSGATLVVGGDGTLTAEGGAGSGNGSGGGAGIGGSGGAGLGGESGDITINSGTIIATGGNGTGSNHSGGGAGIGGGGGGSEDGGGSYGNITIEHADITAHGGSGTGNAGGGAGIGGGGGGGNKSIGGYFGNITISECKGSAAIGGAGGQGGTNGNGGGGAGIGGGGGGGKGGAAGPAGGTISTDGSIPATGGAGGPGGGGAGSDVGGGGGGSTPIITINSQPESQNVLQGETVTLTISAGVTHSATLSYQWYSTTSSSSNTGGTLISGATTNKLTLDTPDPGTSHYYCVVSATGGATPVNSSVATVNVDAITFSINVSSRTLDFGSFTEGYSTQPMMQSVTITNTGTGKITFDPLISVSNFAVSALSEDSLEPGESTSFDCQPDLGLSEYDYSSIIYIKGNFTTIEVELKFKVVSAGKITGTAIIDNIYPKYGDLLTGSLDGGSNSGTLTFKWIVDGSVVHTGTEYTVQDSDVSHEITLEITSDDINESGTLTSSPTAPVLKAAGPTAPTDAPTVASKTYNSITLITIPGYQYSKDGIDWQDEPSFGGLTSNFLYTFYQRIAETATHEASAQSPGHPESTLPAPAAYATLSVGIQNGILKEGEAGTANYPVTTTGFADGSYAATVANLPAGVTVQGGMVTITGNSGILTLETIGSLEGFTPNLQLTLGGITSNNFSLYIGPVSMVPVGTITVTGSDITTENGSSLMTATVSPSDASFQDVQWSVTNGTGSAIISATGLLTATGYGTVTVVASALDGSSVSGSLVITISGQITPPDPTVPRINGPSSLKLVKNYEATSVAFAVTGTAPVTVSKTAGDSHFTWNSTTNALDIAPGLPVGKYDVELTASNPLSPKARFFFTLTVVEAFYFVHIGTYPGGTVTADVYYIADEGQTVTLTATPDEFYVLNDIRVVKTADESVVIPLSDTGDTRTFTMPAHDVTVTASFRDTRATNIDDVKANGLTVYVQSGTLYVNGLVPGAAWSVYNVTGTLIYKGVAGSESANMVLPGRGIYIVHTAEKAIKVSN